MRILRPWKEQQPTWATHGFIPGLVPGSPFSSAKGTGTTLLTVQVRKLRLKGNVPQLTASWMQRRVWTLDLQTPIKETRGGRLYWGSTDSDFKHPLQGTRIPFLVRELRSCMPHSSEAKTKTDRGLEESHESLQRWSSRPSWMPAIYNRCLPWEAFFTQ